MVSKQFVVRRLAQLLLLGSVTTCLTTIAFPQSTPSQSTPAQSTPPQTTATQPTFSQDALKITPNSSRDEPGAGSDFGITADIENISDKPIYLNPQGFTMTAPPELDSDGPREWYAFFSGPVHKDAQGNEVDRWDRVIVLAPHSTTTAFWSGNIQPFNNQSPSGLGRVCDAIAGGGGGCMDHWRSLLRGLTFPPGKYKITIVGSYRDDYNSAFVKTAERHTKSESLTVPIVASQTTILIGAILGGVISFFLLEFLAGWTSSSKIRKFKKGFIGLFSSVLTSTALTILLARLSQTQFIIKVTVNDFWGAITIGFLAAVAGPTILQKLTDGLLAKNVLENAAVDKPPEGATEPASPEPAVKEKQPLLPAAPLPPAESTER